MGKILFLVPKQGAAQREPLEPGYLATIIIFPGVRYERLGDPPAPVRGRAGKARRTRKPRPSPLHA
jgi:hypothetical protein